MAYVRETWKNREVERPRTFTKVENPDGTITLVPAEGNIIEPGTPIIAAKMNNIEDGIVEALDKAGSAIGSLENKVDKVAKKDLSTNDYTDTDKDKLAEIEVGAQKNVTPTKSQVGLANVDNLKQMPIAGGTFTGVTKAQANTSYTTSQLRNTILSTADPSGGSNGDVWIKYV